MREFGCLTIENDEDLSPEQVRRLEEFGAQHPMPCGSSVYRIDIDEVRRLPPSLFVSPVGSVAEGFA